ncbi:MAG: Amuc_1100 family pilus-like protein [Candidatus Omnitrophica bacterium]|nr:Amuc_1100 family pilus-like protein [Candidatus Omnitrophota bacterium]
MNFLRKYFLFITLFLTFGIIGGGLYIIQNLRKESESLSEEIERKREEIREYELHQERAPTAALLAKFNREKVALEAEYRGLEEKFKTYSAFVLAKEEKFPNLYFKESLYITVDDIMERAKKKGINIPSTVGFSETGLPTNEQVPDLLLQLDMIKKLMDVIMETKISTVGSITPGAPASVAFYKEVPIELTITDTSFNVAKFLEALGKSPSIFILDNITLTRKGEMLVAKLRIKGVVREREAR